MRFLPPLLLLGLLSSCAIERYAPATDARVDSALTAAGVPPLTAHKLVFRAPVTFQIGGTGNTASTTAIGKAKAPVASAPHAAATATTTKAGVPWQVYAGGALLLLGLGFYARGRLPL